MQEVVNPQLLPLQQELEPALSLLQLLRRSMMARWKFGLPPCGQVAPSHAKECSPVRVTAYACSLKAVLIMIHERCQQLCPKRENTELGQEENIFLREGDHNLKSSTLISERNTTHFAWEIARFFLIVDYEYDDVLKSFA